MGVYFSNIEELKQRLMPALRLREKELKKEKISITEKELWEYLVEHFWKHTIQLTLAQMVDDILNKRIIEENAEIL